MSLSGDRIPLLRMHPSDAPMVWREGKPVTRERFLSLVVGAAESLPDQPYALNLCDDGFDFIVAFCAVLLRGQTNLLPPNRKEKSVREVLRHYADAYCLTSQPAEGLGVDRHVIEISEGSAPRRDVPVPEVPADHVAVIVFTSGSTGQPKPNPKTWASLAGGPALFLRRFDLEDRHDVAIVATVPPQHMYGLETSVMVPLMSSLSVFGTRPFYAEDIRAALASLPTERLLITTPFHLRICIESGLRWPAVSSIISATAPMSEELAERVESLFGAELREIYGCTEAGSMASRRTLDGGPWRLYDGYTLREQPGGYWVHMPPGAGSVALQDSFELIGDSHFNLIGRDTDMIKVAGKRYSMQELNRRLNQVDGVQEGVFVMPDEENGRETRLAALAVAPGIKTEQILSALKQWLDPVFLPRPLILVDRLPRNDTGKTPRDELLEFLKTMTGQTES